MDSLDLLYSRLVSCLREGGADGSTHECTIAEIYQKLIPYRAVRTELGFSDLPRYEHTLLRLLAGEGEHVRVDLPQVQEEFRTELESGNPILGVYRDYAAVGVEVALREGIPSPGAAAPAPDPPRPAAAPPAAGGSRPEPPAPPPPPSSGANRGPGPVSTDDSACPHCGESLPRGRDARFCPFCGAGIRPAPCPDCGEEVEPSWRFCMGCGHPSPLPGRR